MTHAYLRVDAISPPLSEKYTGPYEVVRLSRNTAVLRIGDKEEKALQRKSTSVAATSSTLWTSATETTIGWGTCVVDLSYLYSRK